MVPFSGIVVTYNEDRWLAECLRSLSFCDDVLVFDLGSVDKTIEIANTFNAKVSHFQRKPIVEEIRLGVIGHAKNDWVIFLDPDEVFPDIYHSLGKMISKDANLGGIRIPLQYYFLGKKLTTTIWGRPRHMLRVVHKQRVLLDTEIHKAITVIHPFTEKKIEFAGENYIKHYWVDSYKKMLEKHARYIAIEGETKYKNGERFSFSTCIQETYLAVKNSLIKYKGWRGGWSGWFLSFFYGWYIFMCFIALRAAEASNRK